MSHPDPRRYASTPTNELETLLRRPDVPPAELPVIEAELDRRYTEELLGTAGQRPYPPATPAQPHPQAAPARPHPRATPAQVPPPPQASAPPAGRPPARQASPRPPAAPPFMGGAPPPGTRPVGPTPPAPPARPAKAGASVLAGCLVTVLVAAVVAVLFTVFQSDDSGPPPLPNTGTTCVVFGRGTCPLSVALPVGSSCTCTDGITVDAGVVQ